jgi:hypothetical protein
MGKTIDMVGFKTDHLVVVGYAGTKNKRAMWNCKCECGRVFATEGKHLRNGSTISCGCYKKKIMSAQGKKNITHNETKTRLYGIWRGIKKRCSLPSDASYKYYGAKGIAMFQEWEESYENFRSWAINNGYSDELTIDRIDNAKGYYPENCRWSDWYVQENNRTNNVRIIYKGESMTKAEVARKLGISRNLLHYRLEHGVPVDKEVRK